MNSRAAQTVDSLTGHVPPEMFNFAALSHAEQCAAIERLADQGLSDYGIAAASRLSVEQVRSILAQRGATR